MSTLGVEVIVIKEKQVLLTLRSDFPLWCLPGGGVDDGETMGQAAIREVYEETGLVVEITRLVGVYSRPDWVSGGDHGVVFTAVPLSGTPKPLDGEATDIRYFSYDNLPEKLFWWQRQRIFDGLFSKTAVVYHQDVPWPFTNLTASETRQKMKQAQFSAKEAEELYREMVTSGKNIREV